MKGSTVVFLALLIAGLMGLVLRMFLTRSLSVSDYGLFYLVFALISFISLFRDLGLNSALTKYIPEFMLKRQFGKVRSSIAIVVLIQTLVALPITIVLFIFSDQVALAVTGTVNASIVIKFLGLWFFLMVFFHAFRSAFRGFQNMVTYALMEVMYIVVTFLMVFSSVRIFNLGVDGVALGYIASASILVILWLVIFRIKCLRILKEKLRIKKPLIKKMLVFALPILIGGIGGIILAHTDTIMIGIFRNSEEVGLYQAAQPLTFLLSYFAAALGVVLLPMTSELWARRKKKVISQAMHFLVKFSFIFIVPAVFVFMAFPDTVLRAFTGKVEYLAAALTLQILTAAVIASTLFAILHSISVGVGKPIVITKVVGAMACLNFVTNLVLIPLYGIAGAAVATFISGLVGLFLLYYLLRKFVRFTVPISSLSKTIVAGLLTLLFILSLKSIIVLYPWWLEAIVVVPPSLLLYAGLILAMRAIRRQDLELLKGVVPIPKRLVRIMERIVRD